MIKKIKNYLKERKKKRFIKKHHIGAHTYLGSLVSINHKDTTIGKFCSIATRIQIGTSQHPTNWLSTHPFQYLQMPGFENTKQLTFENSKPIHIGNDVWIGNDVTILDGIKIYDGAIIGTGAVVTKDVPPYAIVGGVPAKIIRYRFDEKTIGRLLKVQWWNRDIELIKKLPFNDIEKCLSILEASEQ